MKKMASRIIGNGGICKTRQGNRALLNIKHLTLAAIFTRRCQWCGKVCDFRKNTCNRCKDSVFRIEGDVCYHCGREKHDCTCDGTKRFYKFICAPFYYVGAAQKTIVLLKYRNRRDTLSLLADEMAKCVKNRYDGYDFDLCAFVPASEQSQKERGYNQSDLLALGVGRILEIECLPVLEKLIDTPPQYLLPAIKRSRNLLGTIAVKSEMVDKIDNARILLIDDVSTTGATLNECAKTLLIGGAAEVFCVTAALVKKRNYYDI